MKKSYTRGFDIVEMLELRAAGWSTVALGERYGKDHTTIIYHCLKHGVVSRANIRVRSNNQMKTAPGNPTWDQYLKEHSCCGSRGRYRHMAECPAYGSPPVIEVPKIPPKRPHKYDYIFDEPVNPGKSYQEYLADALKRPTERNYQVHIGNVFDVPPANVAHIAAVSGKIRKLLLAGPL